MQIDFNPIAAAAAILLPAWALAYSVSNHEHLSLPTTSVLTSFCGVQGTASICQSFSELITDSPNLTWYGGGTDRTPEQNCLAFKIAASSGKSILLNDGDYHTSCTAILTTLNAQGSTASIIGRGAGRTRIINTSFNQPVVRVWAYAQKTKIEGVTLTRLDGATATEGGDGLVVGDQANQIYVRDVSSNRNYNGYHLGATAFSVLENVSASDNILDGFLFTNGKPDRANMAMQWNFVGRSSAQRDGRNGFSVIAVGYQGRFPLDDGVTLGRPQIVLGQWAGLFAFANGASSVSVKGVGPVTATSGLPVHDFRLTDAFLGSAKQADIFLDTYGRSHTVTGGFIELSGTYNLYATENNTSLNISGTHFSSPNLNAIFSAAKRTSISGSTIESSGRDVKLGLSQRSGVVLLGPDSIIIGGIIEGGTYGVILSGQRGAIIGTNFVNTSDVNVLPQADTIVRGVRGVMDAN